MATWTHSKITHSWHGRCTGMSPIRLRIQNNIIWYDIWKEIDTNAIRTDKLDHYLLSDLEAVGLTPQDIKKYSWIINAGWEGYDKEDIEHFRKLLLSYDLPTTNFGVLYLAYEDIENLPYPAICLTDKMIYCGQWYSGLKKQNVNWDQLPMTSWFTVLMRRASVSRCHLAKRILQHFDPHRITMTLGTSPYDNPPYLKEIIDFPIVVDEKVTPWPMNVVHTHELFYRSPVQLIVESSNEIDVNIWRSIFVTEKSYKALAWHQFPLWYAVPGLVEKIREQGFDVFDDIIDHSYDNEHNPWCRMIAVVEELQKLIRKGCKELRTQYWQRLESNALLVKQIHKSALINHKTQTNRLIDEIQYIHQ